MPWMLKSGLVMTDARDDAIIRDIVIDSDSIVAVGPDLDPSQYGAERVVSVAGKLLIPGLVNTHYHSHDRWDRGRFSPLPLELWMSLTIHRRWDEAGPPRKPIFGRYSEGWSFYVAAPPRYLTMSTSACNSIMTSSTPSFGPMMIWGCARASA